jgi:hypothetical protein
MLRDFATYYQYAQLQGNTEAMEIIKAVILSLLEDV